MPIRQRILAIATAIVLTVTLSGCQLVQLPSLTSAGDKSPVVADTTHLAEVVRVVDGDTIAIEPTDQLPATNERGDEHYVRVLGIDAPEMNKMSDEPAECGAQESTDRMVELLRDHPHVTLVFDAASDHADRFGRSLAYVETTDGDPVDVGLELIRSGLAEAWYPKSEPEPGRFASYLAVQQEATAAGVGAFGSCDTVGR